MSLLFAYSGVEAPLQQCLEGLAVPSKETVGSWGLGCYDGVDAQRVRDPLMAGLVAGFVERHASGCALLLSQQLAPQEPPAGLANCQPFARELMGCMHLFVMEGELAGLEDSRAYPTGVYTPIGETSAEHAFCVLMSRMRVLWQDDKPLPEVRLAVVSDFAARMRPLGLANFVYADSELLFAHGQGKPDDPQQPGLYLHQSEGAVRIASQAPGDAGWQGLEPGEVLVVRRGKVLERCAPFKLWSQQPD
ncbi:class II glutamine amidotransferase [Marinobacterium rhizophilum]|uniref:Class II glutamine amidotransferase n=1 Tax=Marinobacterium rhizophilum TaxID=420402 RepID=A0ABY5HN23_9GAMM|nr:class II glutamine amidotransferase [Marinobacterium rhizophilum]UTW13831.1 class II glutamine amidotransferase [Marinobacterium rhizophilum]